MVDLSLLKNGRSLFTLRILGLKVLILLLVIGISSCNDDNDGDSGPKGKASISVSGAINDSLSFSPTFTVLKDSSTQVPGPLTFNTNVRITGGQVAPDSLKLTVYVLESAPTLSPKAFLVKQLTLETNPDKAVAAILETSDGSIYETQTTNKGEGTLVIQAFNDQRLKGELKAVKLGDGTQTVTLNGSFQAVKP